MKAPENATNISKISKKFRVLRSKGNVNGALKLLTKSMLNGILLLYSKTLDLLIQKHPEPKESSSESLLKRSFRPIHPFTYDSSSKSLVMRATMLTKKGSGRTGLNGDCWRRILTSRQFGNSSSGLRKVLQTSSKSFVQ